MTVLKKRGIIGLPLIISLFLVLGLLSVNKIYASAAEILLPEEYYFVINGSKRQTGTEYEIVKPEELLYITAGSWEPDTVVEWVSSEPNVIELKPSSNGSNFINLVRKGPGYSTIAATVRSGSSSYTLNCHIKVGLALDNQKSGITTIDQETMLLFNNISDEQQLYLKYVDVADAPLLVTWESDNEKIVYVDNTGKLVATGAGTTYINITTSSLSINDKPQNIKLKVVVRPTFGFIYVDTDGGLHDVVSVDNINNAVPAQGVPSTFTIKTNAFRADFLKWEIYDTSTGRIIDNNNTTKMSYSVSSIGDSVSFHGVKAGTYEIFGFADSRYNKNSSIPYAYMKIIVPIVIEDINLEMTVGDEFDLIDNSNIPEADVFKYSYNTGNHTIVKVDERTGIFRAIKYGEAIIQLDYDPTSRLYDSSLNIDPIFVHIKVIDGISLSKSEATIFTSGSLQLKEILTDTSVPVIWTSNNTNIVTVEEGLVKGIKPGIATITATQTINGIVKKATCEITVLQAVEKVVIEPSKVTIPINGTKALMATVTPKEHSAMSITWESSDNSIVAIVNSNGPTAIIQGKSGGNAVISAINTDNVVVGYCSVIVEQPVKSISISETKVTVDLSVGKVNLNATVYPENAFNKKVHWTSSDTSKARVDDKGVVTLLKPGTVTIYAASDSDMNIKSMTEINIDVGVSGISLTEKEKTMFVDQSAILTYSILPLNSTDTSVIWTSTNEKVASVDASGKVTAKSAGNTVIMVKSLDGGYIDYCTITVIQEATGVSLNFNSLELMAGETTILVATILPKDSTKTRVFWESSDTKILMVDTKGKVTAKSSGIATITVRTETGAEAICKINVKQPVKGVMLNFSEKTIYMDQSFKLSASVSPSNASNLNVTWSSSDTNVATVTEDGVVTGKRGGIVTITVTTVDGGIKANCVVKVIELALSIKIDHDSYKLGLKETLTLITEILPSTTTNKSVTWTSSDKSIARVDKSGKVTGVALGYATITATTKDGSGIKASCDIRVVRPVTSIKLNNTYFKMIVGDSLKLESTIKPSNATYRDVNWISSDENVAVIEEDGTITALNEGKITITAYAKDNSGKKTVSYLTVKDSISSTGITIADKKIVMSSWEEKTIKAVLKPIDSTDGFTWSSSNASVAEVNGKTGKIKAKSTGTATITAMTDSGKTATIEVSVVGLDLSELTMEQYDQYRLQVEGNTSRVIWSTDNPSVATVQNGFVVARDIGKATITASVEGKKLTCKITVTKMK